MAQYQPDMKDVERERVLSGHPIYVPEREHIASFIERLRSASTPEDYFELHDGLLRRFFGCQRDLEELGAAKEQSKAAIREAKESNQEGIVRAISRTIKGIDLDRFAANAVLGIYRGLGDALVWTLLGYRRYAITFLGEGPRVGRLALAGGFQAEFAEIRSRWEEDRVVAVHADITTCVQHGDVLAIEEWDPRVINMTEVKTSRASPDSPQMQRLERVTQLINEGEHPTAANGKPLVVQHCPVALENSFSELPELFERAQGETRVASQLSPSLMIEVYDETNPAALSRETIDDGHQADIAKFSDDPDKDLITYSASARRLRDRRHSFSSLAPLALYPLPVDQVAAIAHGAVDFVTTLNATALEAQFAERGVTATVARGTEAGDSFMSAERAAVRVTVPAPLREQMMLELLKEDTLLRVVDWMLDETRRRGTDLPAAALAFENEADYWTPAEGAVPPGA